MNYSYKNNYNIKIKKRLYNLDENSKINLELNYQFKSKKHIIPLNIFQTWSTLKLTPYLKSCVHNIKQYNPEFNYYLYDDKMCYDFIKKHFNKEILYTYDKIIPGAFKSDFWRYCVLYIHGGIYIDIKYKCKIKLLYFTDKEYFVKDRIGINNKLGIYQALLICNKNNPILKKAIDEIVLRCKNNIIGINPLEFSGPQLLLKYFN